MRSGLRLAQGSDVSTCVHVQYTYVHTYIHTYVHTYINTYIHTSICTYIRTYAHTLVSSMYVRTYVHAYFSYTRAVFHASTYVVFSPGLPRPTVLLDVQITVRLAEPVAVQVDGEAWIQQPGSIRIQLIPNRVRWVSHANVCILL